jgi:hypothetical protein
MKLRQLISLVWPIPLVLIALATVFDAGAGEFLPDQADEFCRERNRDLITRARAFDQEDCSSWLTEYITTTAEQMAGQPGHVYLLDTCPLPTDAGFVVKNLCDQAHPSRAD